MHNIKINRNYRYSFHILNALQINEQILEQFYLYAIFFNDVYANNWYLCYSIYVHTLQNGVLRTKHSIW